MSHVSHVSHGNGRQHTLLECTAKSANNGYCIQTTSGNQPWAAFSTW